MSIKWGNVLANVLTGGLPTIVSSLGKTFFDMNSVSKKAADFMNSDSAQSMKQTVNSITGSDGSNTFFGGLSGIFNKLLTGWDDWTGNTANRENIEYQKEYNEQVFNRADTQYQRTVADLRAAGLSGQLAAGAPSTVAGQSAAPERTVGNESQAIERLIGMVNSVKQTNASANLANAQADKARAEARYYPEFVESQIGSNNASAEANRSKASYDAALTHIAMIDGQYKASYWDAQIQDLRMNTNYRNSLISLAKKDQSLRDAQIVGEYHSHVESRARVEKLKQETKNLAEEYYNVQQTFYNLLAQNKHIDAQTELLLKQAVKAQVDIDIAKYNFEFSKESNLRTTDQQTKLNIFGLGSSNLETLLTAPRLDYSPVTGQKRNYGQ